jgi:hypothetical protein
MDTRLGRSFYLSEFTVSAMAERQGKKVEVPDDILPNLRRLVETILQPLRDELDRPIVIISGYRPPWLNKAVGGSRTSAHMDGRAADLIVPGMTPAEVIEVLRRKTNAPFDQAIEEFGRWVHLGIAPDGKMPRYQVLTARKVNGRTVYSQEA